MENYSYNSYPESGGSSPRSREIDFDNPPPWDDQSTATNNNNNYKVKLMCSYGGKICPRPHDNQLAYIGGETKILSVDRTIKFNVLAMKLSTLCDSDMCFKYQLPGEDLDALISVTNDDDLDHMMNEYDRLNRASPKPARLRLFLFPVTVSVQSPAHSFGSTEGRSERERFVEALNSGPVQSAGNADFLFGSEKGVAPIPVPVPAPVTMPVPVPIGRDLNIADPSVRHHEPDVAVLDERAIESDRIQKHIQDLRRLRITEDQQQLQQQQLQLQQQQLQQQNMYRRQSDEYAGDYYVQRTAEKVATTTLPGNVPSPAPGYQISGGFTPSNVSSDQQPVYMVPAPSNMYHAPMARPATGQVSHGQGQGQPQGYYAFQRMPSDVYSEQPVYNAMQPAQPVAAPQQPVFTPQQQVQKTEGIRMVQSTAGMTADGSYGQVAYDNGVGRHVYYTAQGAMVTPHQQPQQPLQQNTHQYHQPVGVAPGTLSQDGKVIAPPKISQGSI